jgi:hypothetical protein
MDVNVANEVVDDLGRKLELRQLSRREVMRFMRMWGPASNIEAWLSLALSVATVKSIDGVPMPAPTTPDQVEALADKLGPEGTKAVGEWYMAQPATDLGAERAAAKN